MKHRPFAAACALAAILSLAAAAAMTARAERPPQLSVPPETLVDEFLSGAAARVRLTPQETAVVRPILIEQTRKRQETARARLAAHPGMAGMVGLRDDMRKIGRETDVRLASVLPPDKLAAIQAYREERREQARQRQPRVQKRE